MTILETNRLLIREFEAGDGRFVVALLNTASWLRYIGDRNVKNETQAMEYLRNGPMKSYREHGFGLYCVDLKDGNIPIGMCGLIKREALQHVDIGFAFLPEYEGKGYAGESALAVLEQARELNLNRIVAITVPENDRSIRLLKKINFSFGEMITLPGSKAELMLFSIDLNK